MVSPPATSSGTIDVTVNTGAGIGVDGGRASVAAASSQAFNTTTAAATPTITIDTSTLATSTVPLISGTTSLQAGSPVLIKIDTNNDGVDDLTYSATVQSGGGWSLDLATETPSSGTFPAAGLSPYAKITATATNAVGVSTSAVGLNKPTVVSQTTNDNTPTVTGTWTQITGDTLVVTLNSVTYSVANGNLTVNATGWSLTPTVALSPDGTFGVTATVTRSTGGTATDPSSSELLIDTAATVTISGGANTDITGNATPTISGASSGIPAGRILTLTLDTDNNGSADVTYKTTIAGDGSWSVNTATALPFSGTFPSGGLTGPIPLTASATDPAGNTGTDTQTLTVDVTPPIIALTFNGTTNDSTPLITGTTDLPVGSTITVQIDLNNDGDYADADSYSATVQTGGNWSVDATTTVLIGTVRVKATGSDSVGNSTTATKSLTIDTAVPVVTITEPIGDGDLNSTEDDSVSILGTTVNVPAGSTFSVSITDGSITINDTATVAAGGGWSLLPFNLRMRATIT